MDAGHEGEQGSARETKAERNKFRAVVAIDAAIKAILRRRLFAPGRDLTGLKIVLQHAVGSIRTQIIRGAFDMVKGCSTAATRVIQQISEDSDERIDQSRLNTMKRYIQRLRSSTKDKDSYNLHKRILILQARNKKMQKQRQLLSETIENLMKRQQRQNQKKRQSLEMLAEELSEKNQLIQDLRKALRQHQEKSLYEASVLEDDVMVMKQDLENFEKIRYRYECDLQKLRIKLVETQGKLKQTEEKLVSREEQNQRVLASYYEYERGVAEVEKIKQQFSEVILQLMAKLKRMNGQHRDNDQSCSFRGSEIVAEAKVSILLMLLDNFTAQHNTKIDLTVFTQKQKDIITEFLIHADHKKQQVLNRGEQKQQDISGIIHRGTAAQGDTILEILEPQPRNHPDSGRAGRVVELELEVRRHVEKIAELKSKIMCLRSIVLNFLREMDLRLTSKAEMALEALFDFFEYSELERESIFSEGNKATIFP